MGYSAIMFDLDGTLADTLADIAAAGNFAMTRLGRPTHAVTAYRPMVGHGARWLIEQALGPTHAAMADDGVRHFKAYYEAHPLDFAKPYDGVGELLDALAARRLPMAVLSNKPDAAAQAVVERMFDRWTFAAIRGHVEGQPLKPDPAGALAVARRLNVDAAHWLYLGDSGVDMQTARAAGMFAVGATWGFRDEPELRACGAAAIVHHPAQVLGLL